MFVCVLWLVTRLISSNWIILYIFRTDGLIFDGKCAAFCCCVLKLQFYIFSETKKKKSLIHIAFSRLNINDVFYIQKIVNMYFFFRG